MIGEDSMRDDLTDILALADALAEAVEQAKQTYDLPMTDETAVLFAHQWEITIQDAARRYREARR